MRYILTLLMISALALLMACQNAQSSTTETKNENPAPAKKTAEKAEKKADDHSADDGHDHGEEAPRINLADAKKAFDSGEAVFIDTRSAVSFKKEHIKGAINVPAGQFEKTYKSVPKDKKIIAYCSWRDENTSARVVQMLMKKGYKNAYALLGGTSAWKDAGYPMEK